MALFGGHKIGVDLGTVNTVIYIHNRGIVLREPSVVAVKRDSEEVVAYGKEAQALQGRTSENYELIYPIQDGVIHGFTLTKKMLSHYIKASIPRGVSRPEVVISVPSQISKVERRAVVDALRDIGIHRAMIVEEPLAAIIGAGISIEAPEGRMVADIGGGTTDVATFSYGEIVNNETIPIGGHRMNELIQSYVRIEHQLVISDETAEKIKLEIGNANYTEADKEDRLEVTGRHASLGTPATAVVEAKLVANALGEAIEQIVNVIRQVLQGTSPELSADILNNGILLTGGGALLKRLPERLEAEIGIPVHLADQAMDCVAMGTGKLLGEMNERARHVERNAR